MSAQMGMPLDYIFLLLQNNEASLAGFLAGYLKPSPAHACASAMPGNCRRLATKGAANTAPADTVLKAAADCYELNSCWRTAGVRNSTNRFKNTDSQLPATFIRFTKMEPTVLAP